MIFHIKNKKIRRTYKIEKIPFFLKNKEILLKLKNKEENNQ